VTVCSKKNCAKLKDTNRRSSVCDTEPYKSINGGAGGVTVTVVGARADRKNSNGVDKKLL
jgi:hypothetical protein